MKQNAASLKNAIAALYTMAANCAVNDEASYPARYLAYECDRLESAIASCDDDVPGTLVILAAAALVHGRAITQHVRVLNG